MTDKLEHLTPEEAARYAEVPGAATLPDGGDYKCSKCLMTFLPKPPDNALPASDSTAAEITRCSVPGCNTLFASALNPKINRIRVWLVPDPTETAEDKVRRLDGQ